MGNKEADGSESNFFYYSELGQRREHSFDQSILNFLNEQENDMTHYESVPIIRDHSGTNPRAQPFAELNHNVNINKVSYRSEREALKILEAIRVEEINLKKPTHYPYRTGPLVRVIPDTRTTEKIQEKSKNLKIKNATIA